MARTNNLSNFLTDVAGAIKEKKGSEVAIPAANFDTEIRNLPSQGTYQHKTVPVTQNGTQTVIPDAGYDAIDELTINTTVPEKQLQTKTYNFTQNATLELTPDSGYDGFNQVNLNINVAGGEVNNQDKTITENGVYTADQGYTGIGTATVNVPQPGNLDIIIPNSINVDMFQQSQNIVLFNIPKNFNGDVFIISYTKWNNEEDWYMQNIGSFRKVIGTVTDAIVFDFWDNGAKFIKLRIAITAQGYNPIVQDMIVNVATHQYGRIMLSIQQDDVKTIASDVIITAENLDDSSILPISITFLSEDFWPTWSLLLPEGAWEIRFTYGSYTSVLDTVFVNNDVTNYSYGYVDLPGFTYNCTHYTEDINNNSVISLASAVITVYDNNDTVLATHTIDYTFSQFAYTYVGDFDHYIVTITDWSANTTDTQTYTSWTDTTYTSQTTNYFGILEPTLDGTYVNTSVSAIQQLITDADISFTLTDLQHQYIRDVDYIICSNSYSSYCIAIKYPSDSSYYVCVKCEGQGYETRDYYYYNNYSGWAGMLDINTEQPIITYNITLKDIDGFTLPMNDYGDIDIPSIGGNARLVEGNNHETILELTTKRSDLAYTHLVFIWPTYDDLSGRMAFTIASYDDIKDYTQDTTLTREIVVPTTINPNYAVCTLMLWLAEGQNVSDMANIIYPTITDENSNTYELVRGTSSAYTDAYYMVKVPAEVEITFEANDFTLNGTTYHASLRGPTINANENIFSHAVQNDAIMIENTSMLRPTGIYAYSGSPTTDITDMTYKIETYRNNVLVDTNVNLDYVYRCPISFYENDEVELRVYRNEGTVDNPEWSTRYAAQQFTVGQPYTWINTSDLIIDQIDAYIDDVPYVNKHVYGINFVQQITNYMEELQTNTVLFTNVEVVNSNIQDITQYMIDIYAEIYDIDNDEYTEYEITYDSVNKVFTYTDSTDLPDGHYYIYVVAVDQFGNAVHTPYTLTIGPIFPFEDNLPYTCDNGAIINSIEGEYNNGLTSFIIHDIDFKDVDGVLNQGLYTFDMVLYDMDDNILNTLHTLGTVMFNGYHKTITDGRASITSDYRNTARIEITNVQYSPS